MFYSGTGPLCDWRGESSNPDSGAADCRVRPRSAPKVAWCLPHRPQEIANFSCRSDLRVPFGGRPFRPVLRVGLQPLLVPCVLAISRQHSLSISSLTSLSSSSSSFSSSLSLDCVVLYISSTVADVFSPFTPFSPPNYPARYRFLISPEQHQLSSSLASNDCHTHPQIICVLFTGIQVSLSSKPIRNLQDGLFPHGRSPRCRPRRHSRFCCYERSDILRPFQQMSIGLAMLFFIRCVRCRSVLLGRM